MEDEIQYDEFTYEQAFKALEEVVATLENGEHSLEEALKLFERGQTLARRCSELLDNAELKVQQLTEEDSLVEIE
jgi:exodeoxyribonuclease VII small subunit